MRILRNMFLAIILFLCLSLFSCSPLLKYVGEETSKTISLDILAYEFWQENHRWPEDERELRSFAQKSGSDFDWSQYSNMQFLPQPDGSLRIEFELAPPRSGTGYGTVKIPEETKERKKQQ